MKIAPLAFLAFFSLLFLCSIADGRKYPEKYWGKGRNLRVVLEAEEGFLGTSSEPIGSGGGGDPKEKEALSTSSEPVGGGSNNGGDPKETGPLIGTILYEAGGSLGGNGSGPDPKVEKPRRTRYGGGDPKGKKGLIFGYRRPPFRMN